MNCDCHPSVLYHSERERSYYLICGRGHHFSVPDKTLKDYNLNVIECPQCRGEAAERTPGPLDALMRMSRAAERVFAITNECEEEEARRRLKWDRRYLELAEFVSRWSKDPSTKSGAVIVGTDGSVISLGYNGFAKGVNDSPERYGDRDTKYKMVVHCERNAIIFGDRDRMRGATLYTFPFMSCSVCASLVIQAGIRRCVAPVLPDHLAGRWGEDIKLARAQFAEAGVELTEVLSPADELAKTYADRGIAVTGSGRNVMALFGRTGSMACLMNVPHDEAVRRCAFTDEPPRVFRCGDEFEAYDAGEAFRK